MEIIQGGPALIRCVLQKGLRSETGVRNMLLFSAMNKHSVVRGGAAGQEL